MAASKSGHYDIVQMILKSPQFSNHTLPAYVDKQDQLGASALIYAAHLGYHGCATVLLAAGATLTLQDEDGQSALDHARQEGEGDMVKLLKAHRRLLKVGPDEFDSQGLAYIHRAAMVGCEHEIQYLIAYGAKLDIPDRLSNNDVIQLRPLQWLAKCADGRSCIRDMTSAGATMSADSPVPTGFGKYLASAGRLVDAGVTVDAPDRDGRTALIVLAAAREGDAARARMAELLLGAGADPNAEMVADPSTFDSSLPGGGMTNVTGVTSLFLASQWGLERVATTLLGAGADVNIRGGPQGMTALHSASVGGHPGIIERLCHANASVFDIEELFGFNALMLAAKGQEDTTHPFPVAPHAAVPANHTEAVNAILHCASVANPILGERHLLRATEHQGWTALMYASRYGHDAIVQRLSEGDADYTGIDTQDDKGWTALMKASWQGHLATVHALVTAGADRTVAGADGATALDLSRRGDNNPKINRILQITVETTIHRSAGSEEGLPKERQPRQQNSSESARRAARDVPPTAGVLARKIQKLQEAFDVEAIDVEQYTAALAKLEAVAEAALEEAEEEEAVEAAEAVESVEAVLDDIEVALHFLEHRQDRQRSADIYEAFFPADPDQMWSEKDLKTYIRKYGVKSLGEEAIEKVLLRATHKDDLVEIAVNGIAWAANEEAAEVLVATCAAMVGREYTAQEDAAQNLVVHWTCLDHPEIAAILHGGSHDIQDYDDFLSEMREDPLDMFFKCVLCFLLVSVNHV
jgi:ankyrin repeat protein